MNDPRLLGVVYSAADISSRVDALAQQMCAQFQQAGVDEVDLVTVLNGAVPFSRDFQAAFGRYNGGRVLVRPQTWHVVSSDGTKSSGSLRFLKDLYYPVEGKNVLVAEDIVDTGLTATGLLSELYQRGAVDVTFMTMIDKPLGRTLEYSNFKPHVVGFVYRGNKWLVGKGLDVDGKYRELSEIYEYEPDKS